MAGFFVALRIRMNTSILASWQTPFDISTIPEPHAFLRFAIKSALLLIFVMVINQMYTLRIQRPLSRELGKLPFLIASWTLLMIAYFFFMRVFPFSRLVLIYGVVATWIFLSGERIALHLIQRWLLKKGIGRLRVLIVGQTKLGKELAEKIEHHIAYDLIATIAPEELEKTLKTKHPDLVIQTQDQEKTAEHMLALCRQHHVRYGFVPDILEVQKTNVDIRTIRGLPLIELKPTPLEGWGSVAKRLMDIIGSAIGIIIATPIILIAAIAIKIDSHGPIFFLKLDDGSPVTRVGQFGKLFRFYKLRTMLPGRHNERYSALSEKNLRNDSPLVKIKNDPRITRVGHYLRRLSVDELPQLWSVLKGDMSLVGPRPHFPEEIAKYTPEETFVLEIKPGITGLAQISGRSDLNFKEEIRLDTYYIQNWSIGLDIKIILKTLIVVLRGYEE